MANTRTSTKVKTAIKTVTKKLITNVPLEKVEQKTFVAWLRLKGIPFYAIPNGGSRGGRYINGKWVCLEGIELERQGCQAGIPDICIPVARKSFHGLYIELKRVKRGYPSDQQKYWIDLLKREGYLAVIAKGADAAIKIVEDYMA